MKLTIYPDKLIRQKSIEVNLPLNKEDKYVTELMIEYIDESQKEGSTLRAGIGIAAVQLGFLKRMFYMNVPLHDGSVYKDFIINPIIKSESATYAALKVGEGCLSVSDETPNQEGFVHRKNRIIFTGYSLFDKKQKEYDFNGFLAIVAQHELDHLDGKLFIDRIDKKAPHNKKDDEIIIDR